MIEWNLILSMALPGIADIAAASKRKKRERDLLTRSYDNLLSVTDIDFTDIYVDPASCEGVLNSLKIRTTEDFRGEGRYHPDPEKHH